MTQDLQRLLLVAVLAAFAEPLAAQFPLHDLPPQVLPPPAFSREVLPTGPAVHSNGRALPVQFVPEKLPPDVLDRFEFQSPDEPVPAETSSATSETQEAPLPFVTPGDVHSPSAIPLPAKNEAPANSSGEPLWDEITAALDEASAAVGKLPSESESPADASMPADGRRVPVRAMDFFRTLRDHQSTRKSSVPPTTGPTEPAAASSSTRQQTASATRPSKSGAENKLQWPVKEQRSVWDTKLPAHPAARSQTPSAVPLSQSETVNPFVDDPVDEEGNTPIPPIGSLSVVTAPPDGRMPADRAATYFDHEEVYVEHREIPVEPVGTPYYWVAAGSSHNPLYFEEVNLERYGYNHGIFQPAVSAAHFFGTLPALPYLMAANPPHSCSYTLGHYRPGSCVPLRHHHWPLSLRGALAQGGVATGLVFLIP